MRYKKELIKMIMDLGEYYCYIVDVRIREYEHSLFTGVDLDLPFGIKASVIWEYGKEWYEILFSDHPVEVGASDRVELQQAITKVIEEVNDG